VVSVCLARVEVLSLVHWFWLLGVLGTIDLVSAF